MKNSSFEIIAVLDLKDGKVVHAVAGNRENYRAVQSILCDSPEIGAVMEAMITKQGITTFYLADLDAIAGQTGNLAAISEQIKAYRNNETLPCRIRFFLDAGISDSHGVARLLMAGIDSVIIGTETLSSLNDLQDILTRYGTERIMVSLDIRDGKVLTQVEALRQKTPLDVLDILLTLGVYQVLFIELDRVGTGRGLNEALILGALERMRKACPTESMFYLGGGVGCLEELQLLRAWGVNGVMIATMLHNGTLSRAELQSLTNE